MTIKQRIFEIIQVAEPDDKISKVFDGIYTRTFTESEIENSSQENLDKGRVPYDITTKSNYYYIIRESGGIITGAYVDNRNEEIVGNPYINSNIGYIEPLPTNVICVGDEYVIDYKKLSEKLTTEYLKQANI